MSGQLRSSGCPKQIAPTGLTSFTGNALDGQTFAAVGDISANLLHNMNNKVGTIPVRIQAIQDKYQPMLEANSYLAINLKEIERSAADAMQIVQENLSHLRPIRIEPVKIAARVSRGNSNRKYPGRCFH